MKTLIKSDGLASPLSPSDLHGLRLADDTNKRRKQSRRLAVVTSSNPLCRSRGRRSGLLGSADVDYQCAGDDCRRETMCDACWSYTLIRSVTHRYLILMIYLILVPFLSSSHSSGVASYGAQGHVPSLRLKTISFLVHFRVNLTANYTNIV